MQSIELNQLSPNSSAPIVPPWLIWTQCISFVVLYAVWILPEIVGFRNTALVLGALAGLYPIYQFRNQLLTKRAIPIWLIVALFAWAIFHLIFLSQDYALQFLELKRIWKYTGLAVIFAFGLGLSLTNAKSQKYWYLIYFGLMTPLLIYLVKYFLTMYGTEAIIAVYPSLKITASTLEPFYIPKTDYVAFSLPIFGICLGSIGPILLNDEFSWWKKCFYLMMIIAVTLAVLFLFYVQNVKNGFAYALIIIGLFTIHFYSMDFRKKLILKTVFAVSIILALSVSLKLHFQNNSSWDSLIADANVAFQTEKYQHWKYAGAQDYPNNELGRKVSATNYERTAWAKVGVNLAVENPLGYGLVEDSFKRLAKARWPEVSPNLSHSHSGWIDLILGLGFPGFICVFGALLWSLRLSLKIDVVWKNLVFWGLLTNLLLWCTTEVCANVTFMALLFWLALASGLSIKQIPSRAN